MIKSKTGLLKKRSFVLKKGHLYIILLNYTFQWYANNSDLLRGRGGGGKKKLLFLLTINIIKMEICWLFRYNLNSVILEMIWSL